MAAFAASLADNADAIDSVVVNVTLVGRFVLYALAATDVVSFSSATAGTQVPLLVTSVSGTSVSGFVFMPLSSGEAAQTGHPVLFFRQSIARGTANGQHRLIVGAN